MRLKEKYARMVREIDGWFGSIRAKYASEMQCGRGCALCCPFLGEHDECLIYENRPMACRLEGVPMIDIQMAYSGTCAS